MANRRSVDVGIIEIVLEAVEEVGVGELVIDGDDALTEDLKRINIVDVHGHRGSLVV